MQNVNYANETDNQINRYIILLFSDLGNVWFYALSI